MLHFLISKTTGKMIIDDSDSLQSCINSCWSYKTESSLLKIFGNLIRKFWLGLIICHRLKCIINNFPNSKWPDIGIKRSKFWLNIEKCLSVGDGRNYLVSVTDNSFVLHQLFYVLCIELYNFLRNKICKCLTIVLTTL